MSDDELNVRAWRVSGFQTSRGFAGNPRKSDEVEDFVGLTLRFEDLPEPGYFIMTPDEADQIAIALADTARRARLGIPDE